MDKSSVSCISRREFTVAAASGCALCCLGSRPLIASAVCQEPPRAQPEKHKFDSTVERELTYKSMVQMCHRRYIGILKQLEKETGKERLLEMLKKATHEDSLQLGKRLSDRIPSLQAFTALFKDERSDLSHTIVREIVEDSERAFEIRVTECLSEVVFREANALDLGYACVCHADFGLPVGINPKFKLIRTKTLMQGHDCCNHRYVWEE